MIEKPVEKIFSIEAPLDLAWKSTIQALVEKGVNITILDKENRLIIIEEQMNGENFQQFVAEKTTFFITGLVKLNILFQEENEGKLKVFINSTLQGFTGRWVVYPTSNGKIEKDYLLLITNNLPQKKSYPWLDKKKEVNEIAPPAPSTSP